MTITFADDPLLAHPAPPRPSPILLEFMRPPVAHVIDRWWTVETHGEENLPQGASIVAPNHQGTLDAIVDTQVLISGSRIASVRSCPFAATVGAPGVVPTSNFIAVNCAAVAARR